MNRGRSERMAEMHRTSRKVQVAARRRSGGSVLVEAGRSRGDRKIDADGGKGGKPGGGGGAGGHVVGLVGGADWATPPNIRQGRVSTTGGDGGDGRRPGGNQGLWQYTGPDRRRPIPRQLRHLPVLRRDLQPEGGRLPQVPRRPVTSASGATSWICRAARWPTTTRRRARCPAGKFSPVDASSCLWCRWRVCEQHECDVVPAVPAGNAVARLAEGSRGRGDDVRPVRSGHVRRCAECIALHAVRGGSVPKSERRARLRRV